jgi:hypothetical protein
MRATRENVTEYSECNLQKNAVNISENCGNRRSRGRGYPRRAPAELSGSRIFGQILVQGRAFTDIDLMSGDGGGSALILSIKRLPNTSNNGGSLKSFLSVLLRSLRRVVFLVIANRWICKRRHLHEQFFQVLHRISKSLEDIRYGDVFDGE